MKTILIVEDEDLVLSLVEPVLQDAGYETISAGTVSDARAIIIDSKQRVDMVFTDIGLPNHPDGGLWSADWPTGCGPAYLFSTQAGSNPSTRSALDLSREAGFCRSHIGMKIWFKLAALCC